MVRNQNYGSNKMFWDVTLDSSQAKKTSICLFFNKKRTKRIRDKYNNKFNE